MSQHNKNIVVERRFTVASSGVNANLHENETEDAFQAAEGNEIDAEEKHDRHASKLENIANFPESYNGGGTNSVSTSSHALHEEVQAAFLGTTSHNGEESCRSPSQDDNSAQQVRLERSDLHGARWNEQDTTRRVDMPIDGGTPLHFSWNLQTRLGYPTSKYAGVSWNREKNEWIARTMVNYRRNHLGFFDSDESATLKYDKIASRIDRPVHFPAGSTEDRAKKPKLRPCLQVGTDDGHKLKSDIKPMAVQSAPNIFLNLPTGVEEAYWEWAQQKALSEKDENSDKGPPLGFIGGHPRVL